MGIRLYNKVPDYIKMRDNFKSFRRLKILSVAAFLLFSGWIYGVLISRIVKGQELPTLSHFN
jgi:hypothetical protein